jgi:hypothetical protein
VGSAALPVPHLPWLDHQSEVFHCTAPNVVYVKGRRAGGTMGMTLRAIELCYEKPGSHHLWIDTVHRNIGRYIPRYFLPNIPPGECDWQVTKHSLVFANGSLVDFGSAQLRENIEGFGYDYLWVNEAGIVLKDDSLYYNTLRPMLLDAGSAQSFFTGTPKGRGLFQRMYYWGQDEARPDWRSFRQPSSVNTHLSAPLLEELRHEMPERVYRQEILAEFVADESQVFNGLERAAVATPEDVPAAGAVYVMGVDLARHRDYTAVWVGRLDTQAAIHCERFHGIPWQQQVERLQVLSRRYGQAIAYADATGVGDAVCEQLAAAGVPVCPMRFTSARKAALIERLAACLEQGTFTLVPHEPTLRELEVFEYQRTAFGGTRLTAPAGQHDDCVIALALCLWGMEQPRGGFIFGPSLVTRDDEEI